MNDNERVSLVAEAFRSHYWRWSNWRVEPNPNPDEDEEAVHIVADMARDKPSECGKVCPCWDTKEDAQVLCNLLKEVTTIAQMTQRLDYCGRVLLRVKEHLANYEPKEDDVEEMLQKACAISLNNSVDKAIELITHSNE